MSSAIWLHIKEICCIGFPRIFIPVARKNAIATCAFKTETHATDTTKHIDEFEPLLHLSQYQFTSYYFILDID